jgi:ketosteroid isomerase-like protein
MTGFVDSMIRRDLEAALSLLTDDVAFFYSNGSALWGKEAFAATMTANW